jgi:hypothetical protein
MSRQSSDRRRLLADRRMCVRPASVTITACQRRRPMSPIVLGAHPTFRRVRGGGQASLPRPPVVSTSSVSSARSAPSSADSTSRSHSQAATSSISASWSPSTRSCSLAASTSTRSSIGRWRASSARFDPPRRSADGIRSGDVGDRRHRRPPAGGLRLAHRPELDGRIPGARLPVRRGHPAVRRRTLWASGRAIYERLDPDRQSSAGRCASCTSQTTRC